MPNEPDKYQEDFDKRLVDTNSELETTRKEKADLEEKVSELQVSLANAHNAQVDLECTVTANKVRCSVLSSPGGPIYFLYTCTFNTRENFLLNIIFILSKNETSLTYIHY